MLDLGSLKLAIKVDSEEAKAELESVKETVGETAGNLKKDIVDGAKKAAAGLAGLTTAAVAVTESTRDYRTEQSKLKTAFEEAGFSAETAKETYSELNGILGDSGQAVEAANHLAKLCDTEEELSKWTDIAAGVYGTFGDSLPIEGLMEAANETAKTGQVVGSLADALNWSAMEGETFGVQLQDNIEFTKLSNKELEQMTDSQREEYENRKLQYEAIEEYNKQVNEAASAEDLFNIALQNCSTEAERQQLITDTLTNSYKSAGDTYRQNSEDIIAANEANEKLQDSMARLGETLEPVITSVKEFASEALGEIGTFVENHQDQINGFVDAILNFGHFIIDNAGVIEAGLIGIGVGLAVFKIVSTITSLVSAFKSLQLALGGVSVAQAALNIVMSMNPIGIIIALIAGLVAAFVVLWNKCEGFRNFWKAVWDGIKTVISLAVQGVKNTIQTMLDVVNNIKDAFVGLWDKIKEVWDNITTWISEAVDNIVETVSGIGSSLYDAGANIITSLWDGLKGAWTSITDWVNEKVQWVQDKFNGIKDAVKGVLGLDGSHRTGLREVPYDGYVAQLHKGEMVLTAAEANRYQNQGGNGQNVVYNTTVNNYSPKALNEAESARQFRKTQRELALGF